MVGDREVLPRVVRLFLVGFFVCLRIGTAVLFSAAAFTLMNGHWDEAGWFAFFGSLLVVWDWFEGWLGRQPQTPPFEWHSPTPHVSPHEVLQSNDLRVIVLDKNTGTDHLDLLGHIDYDGKRISFLYPHKEPL